MIIRAINCVLGWAIRYRLPWVEDRIYDFRCPRPLSDAVSGHVNSARACCAAGECGCNNQDRYPHPIRHEDTAKGRQP